VDNPAQVGAVAVLMKRAEGEFADIRKNAAAVAAGEKPIYGVTQYEDAMFARAGELAKGLNCSPEQAFSKCLTTDHDLRELAYASEVARATAYGAEVRKRHAAA
jgi:hypothetical protein